jgi:hypothetical protein
MDACTPVAILRDAQERAPQDEACVAVLLSDRWIGGEVFSSLGQGVNRA